MCFRSRRRRGVVEGGSEGGAGGAEGVVVLRDMGGAGRAVGQCSVGVEVVCAMLGRWSGCVIMMVSERNPTCIAGVSEGGWDGGGEMWSRDSASPQCELGWRGVGTVAAGFKACEGRGDGVRCGKGR